MKKEIQQKDLGKYEKLYSKDSLMTKISRFAKKAGLNTTYYVLLLYQMLISGKTPLKYKAVVIGALGYFICPIDLIPDMMIGTGFLDDASVLLYALSMISESITPEIKGEAKNILHQIFDFEDNELDSTY
jgi:uncharacterized membrane protein YkvA (DUF1232 family)